MSSEANQQNAKITVHWLNKSRGQRIIWLLEELKVDYEIKVYKRDKHFRAPGELKDVHPLGKSPTITIETPGQEKPLVLAESGPIVEYLCDYFGPQFIPRRYPEGKDGVIGAETEQWLRHRYIMHYAESSLMPVLFTLMLTGNIRNAPVPFFLKFLTGKIADNVDNAFTQKELKSHFTFLEDYLAKSPDNGEFFCGSSLTGADFMMIFVLEGAVQGKVLNETTYPKLYSYVRRLQDREAYKRAGERVSDASGDKFVPFSDVKL